MKLYVVQMYRYGDEDGHSYIEGVYDTQEEAEKHGKAEEEERGGKYDAKIQVHPLNESRKLKYMTDEEINKSFDEALRLLKENNPDLYKEWFEDN